MAGGIRAVLLTRFEVGKYGRTAYEGSKGKQATDLVSSGTVVNAGPDQTTAGGLDAIKRARFVAARLTVTAKSGKVKCDKPPFSRPVLIPLPLVVSNNFEVVDESVDVSLVATPGLLIRHLMKLADGDIPHIGSFTQEKTGEYVSVDPDSLRNTFT